jgi:hypothetical protein
MRSLGVRLLGRTGGHHNAVARGCTYPSLPDLSWCSPIAIGQPRCIYREASFLIRRSNNSGRGPRGACLMYVETSDRAGAREAHTVPRRNAGNERAEDGALTTLREPGGHPKQAEAL